MSGLDELFFQLCCRVSFWFWQEIGFGLHTYVLRVPYSCGVVSVFVILAGNSFWYVRTYHTVVVCVVLVFWFWQEIVFGVTYVHSVQYSCAVVFLKNDYSVSLFLEKQLASQSIFLVKSKLSITTYLFLVFYKSTLL